MRALYYAVGFYVDTYPHQRTAECRVCGKWFSQPRTGNALARVAILKGMTNRHRKVCYVGPKTREEVEP